jgi:cytoskeletal protein RodZ
MNDFPRRSPLVRVLDMIIGAAAAVQAGPTPQARVRPATSRMRLVLAMAVVVALGGTALLIWVFVRAPGDPDLLPEQAAVLPGSSSSVRPTTSGSSPSASAAPSASASRGLSATTPSASAASLAIPSLPLRSTLPESAPAPLTAGYTTTAGLLGYKMTVTIANPAAVAQQNWQLTITLPRSTLTVANVAGATAEQDKATWTFTPDASTARIPAAGSAKLTFDVRGATLIDAAPKSCQINEHPCG